MERIDEKEEAIGMDKTIEKTGAHRVVEIPLERLEIHPMNVRKEYEGIDELADSIRENGIMQNLTVVPEQNFFEEQYRNNPTEEARAAVETSREKQMYFVVIGNRRLLAAREAGIETAPCAVVESMDNRAQVTTMLTENMNRKDLKIYEESAAIQMCFEDFGINMESMHQMTGLSKSTIRRRLNVAKLDREILEEKAKDGEFQMTLHDLYSLEKIQDVETRNKVLEEARDSRDLANRARAAAREELHKNHKAEYEKLLKAAGIGKAPKEVNEEFYSGKWDRLNEYRLDDDVPEEIAAEEEGELFYVERYGSMYIVRKAKKQKRELSEWEIKERERKKTEREIKGKYKVAMEDMGDFIRNLFDGKVEPIKDTTEMGNALWDILLNRGAYIGMSDVARTILGKDQYAKSVTPEEREGANEKARSLPELYQKIAVVHNCIRSLEMTNYKMCYNEKNGTRSRGCTLALQNTAFRLLTRRATKS